MTHKLNPAFLSKINKKPVKEKHKTKDEFKKLSNAEKDELLYALAMERGFLPQTMPYNK